MNCVPLSIFLFHVGMYSLCSIQKGWIQYVLSALVIIVNVSWLIIGYLCVWHRSCLFLRWVVLWLWSLYFILLLGWNCDVLTAWFLFLLWMEINIWPATLYLHFYLLVLSICLFHIVHFCFCRYATWVWKNKSCMVFDVFQATFCIWWVHS